MWQWTTHWLWVNVYETCNWPMENQIVQLLQIVFFDSFLLRIPSANELTDNKRWPKLIEIVNRCTIWSIIWKLKGFNYFSIFCAVWNIQTQRQLIRNLQTIMITIVFSRQFCLRLSQLANHPSAEKSQTITDYQSMYLHAGFGFASMLLVWRCNMLLFTHFPCSLP